MAGNQGRPAGLRGYIVLSLIWLAVLAGVILIVRRPPPAVVEILPAPTAVPTPIPAYSPAPAAVRVDVAGAVVAPGVYSLPPGSRVVDALAAAGGALNDADLDLLNKAAPVADGMQVYVPRRSEETRTLLVYPTQPARGASVQAGFGGQPGAGGLIDLNTATLAELETLPGIGPALAQRIIDGRPYAKVEDVLEVKGIGDATFARFRELVAVH